MFIENRIKQKSKNEQIIEKNCFKKIKIISNKTVFLKNRG